MYCYQCSYFKLAYITTSWARLCISNIVSSAPANKDSGSPKTKIGFFYQCNYLSLAYSTTSWAGLCISNRSQFFHPIPWGAGKNILINCNNYCFKDGGRSCNNLVTLHYQSSFSDLITDLEDMKAIWLKNLHADCCVFLFVIVKHSAGLGAGWS